MPSAQALRFTLYDATLGLGASGVEVPPHSIQTYVLPAAAASPLGDSVLAELPPASDAHETPPGLLLAGFGLLVIAAATLVARRRHVMRHAPAHVPSDAVEEQAYEQFDR